jgi:hypothetical protein
MKYKKFLKGKAVVTTVIAVFLVCSMSAIIPTIYGQNTTKLLENKKESTIENMGENYFSELFQNRDTITVKELIESSENIAKQNSNNWPNSIKNLVSILKNVLAEDDFKIPIDFLNQYGNKLVRSKSKIQSLMYIQQEISGKLSINEASPKLQSFRNSNIICKSPSEDDFGFNNYWENYETCLALWLTNPTSIYYPDWYFMQVMNFLNIYSRDNYVDWWYESERQNIFVMELVTLSIAIGVILLLSTRPILGIGLGILGTGLVVAGAYLAGGYAAYVYYSSLKFVELLDKEVDMHIRFINNNTEEGITNLHIDPNYIRMKNDDAIEKCDDSSGQDPDPIEGDFVYEIKLDEAFHDNETGWYSLSARGDNFDELYVKPPCPPGNWTISVFADGYEPIEDMKVSISTSHFILRSGQKTVESFWLFPSCWTFVLSHFFTFGSTVFGCTRRRHCAFCFTCTQSFT